MLNKEIINGSQVTWTNSANLNAGDKEAIRQLKDEFGDGPFWFSKTDDQYIHLVNMDGFNLRRKNTDHILEIPIQYIKVVE